ncbi:MAG: hypothetical protein DRJ07_05355 [Bacteroidetes bacterium]|nr:MAG: hypothetical protein DRJ07_05355 [Bacteroidota bacterium]
MELQDLTSIWNMSDDSLSNNLKVNKDLFKEVSVSKIKSHLYEIKWSAIFEIVVNILFFNYLLGFIIKHYTDLNLLIPAVILQVIFILSIILKIYNLRLFYSINSQNSIVETQKSLARLMYLQLLDTKTLYFVIPVFSTAFLIVMTKAVLNLNLYFLDSWLIYNTIGSFFVGIVIVFLFKKYPSKNLQNAITFLDELKEIEKLN